MCGISCILTLSGEHFQRQDRPRNGELKQSLVSRRQKVEQELDASLAQIKHRGPDSCGNWISDDCRVGTLAQVLLLPNRHWAFNLPSPTPVTPRRQC